MRRVLLNGRATAFVFAVASVLSCSPGFAAGPLGSVEIERGEPIEIRALLSETVVTSVSPLIGTAIELAVEDFGPLHGHGVSIETLDEMCSGAKSGRI